MNKLFSKIAVFAVGAAMAVGVGVAASRSFAEASAIDTVTYSLVPFALANEGDNNKYEIAKDVVCDEVTWNLMGNLTLTPWRIGGKKSTTGNGAGADRAIYSKTAIADNVTKIVIKVGAASDITVTSLTVGVYSTAALAEAGGTGDVASFTPTFTANSNIEVSKQDATDWSNCFYRITFNVKVTATSNKYIAFNGIDLYKDVSGSIDSVTVKGPEEETGTLNVTSGLAGLTNIHLSADVQKTGAVSESVTWASSDSTTSVVDENGYVRLLKNGSSTITATSVADSSKSGSIVINASGLEEYPNVVTTADFTDKTKWGEETISDFTAEIGDDVVIKDGGASTTKFSYNKDGQARVYSGTSVLITSESPIDYIVFTSAAGNPFSAAPSTIDGVGHLFGLDWLIDCSADPKNSVLLTYGGTTAYINGAIVYHDNLSQSISVSSDKEELAKDEVATITTTLLNGATGIPTYVADPAAAVTLTPSADGKTCTVTANPVAATTDVTITVSLAGCADKQVTISVKKDAAITGINITAEPTKKVYNQGENELSLVGLAVEIVYDDSTTEPLDTSLVDAEFDFSTPGNNIEVVIKYLTFQDTYTVTVNAIEELSFATAVSYMSGLNTPAADQTLYYPANCAADAATIFDVVGYVSGKRTGSGNSKTVYIAETIEKAETKTDEIQAYHITISDEDYASLTVGSEVKIRGKLAVFSTSKTMEIMESTITIIHIRPIVPVVKTAAEAVTLCKAITPAPENGKSVYVSSWQTYQVDGYVASTYDKNRTLYIVDDLDNQPSQNDQLQIAFIDQAIYDTLKTVGTKVRAVGLLSWFKNAAGTRDSYQISNPESVIELEPAPEIVPIEVNVAGAVDACADTTPANPAAYVSNTQTYKVTGYVKNVFGWSDDYKDGNVAIVDSSEGTGTPELLLQRIGAENKEAFEATYIKGAKVTVTGLLAVYKKSATEEVKYELMSCVVDEVVPPAVVPTSLDYVGELEKTEYEIGEDFDTTLAGITKFVVTYSDSTTEAPHTEDKTLADVTIDASAFDKTTAGDYNITVSYTEGDETVSCLLQVTVKPEEPGPGPEPVTLVDITVTNSKSNYQVGDILDYNAITVTMVYSDQSTREGVISTDYGFTFPEGFDGTFTAAGEVTIVVYAKADETIKKNVVLTVSAAPVVLTSITVETTVTEYTVGDQIDPNSITITAHYSDGTSEVVTTGFIVTFDSSEAGDNVEVTISYTEDGVTKSASFYVTVKAAPSGKKGCGGDIAATSIILSTLSLAGVALLALKKRKED